MYQNKLETGFLPSFLNKLRANFVNVKKKQMQSILSYLLGEGQWKTRRNKASQPGDCLRAELVLFLHASTIQSHRQEERRMWRATITSLEAAPIWAESSEPRALGPTKLTMSCPTLPSMPGPLCYAIVSSELRNWPGWEDIPSRILSPVVCPGW